MKLKLGGEGPGEKLEEKEDIRSGTIFTPNNIAVNVLPTYLVVGCKRSSAAFRGVCGV